MIQVCVEWFEISDNLFSKGNENDDNFNVQVYVSGHLCNYGSDSQMHI